MRRVIALCLFLQDPQDEEEQSRVRSQAQALLDCVADLVVHSGLQGAVALLSEGAQLQRVPSGMGSAGGVGSPHSGSDILSRMGSETWRIVGSMPPGFGEGAAPPSCHSSSASFLVPGHCYVCTGSVSPRCMLWDRLYH